MKVARVWVVGFVLVGSITMTQTSGAPLLSAAPPLVAFGNLASGSSGGLNGSVATATVTTTLLSTSTNVLWLNNTDSSTWYARLNATSFTGLASVTAMQIGIDNGSTTVQVIGALGAISQTGGSYVALAAGSANKIYITDSVSLLGTSSTITLDLYASDATDDSAYVVTHATLTLS